MCGALPPVSRMSSVQGALPLSGVYCICTLLEHTLVGKLVFASICCNVTYTLFFLTVCCGELLISYLPSVLLCYFHIKIHNLVLAL